MKAKQTNVHPQAVELRGGGQRSCRQVTPAPDDDFRDVMLRTTGLDLPECPACRQRSLERRPLPSRALAPARAPPTEVAA